MSRTNRTVDHSCLFLINVVRFALLALFKYNPRCYIPRTTLNNKAIGMIFVVSQGLTKYLRGFNVTCKTISIVKTLISFHLILVTAINGKSKQVCDKFLPGRLKWSLLPKKGATAIHSVAVSRTYYLAIEKQAFCHWAIVALHSVAWEEKTHMSE